MTKIKKIFLTILCIFIGIAILYFAGCYYFHTHFYSNINIMGVNTQNKTVSNVNLELSNKISSWKITLETRNGNITLSATDIGISTNNTDKIQNLFNNQNPFLWPIKLITKTDDYNYIIISSEQSINTALSKIPIFQKENMQKPTDAYITYKNGEYVIENETLGTIIDYNDFASAVLSAMNNGEKYISLEEYYQNPEITSDNENLIQECSELNNLISTNINYDMGDNGTFFIDSDLISSWINLEDDFSYSLDTNAISDYIQNMALATDTFGLSHTFTTHDGNTITLSGGDYGWCINKSETTNALIDMINNSYQGNTEPIYLYSALDRNKNDIGNSYVEINIAKQTMYIYNNGECIIETPVVTGNTSLGRGTPTGGVWAVDYKMTDATLKGEGYNSHVNYWLPFNGNVGIHDADWRSSFGGTIYQSDGSHGCINTPPDIMPEVYANVEIGWPVIVY